MHTPLVFDSKRSALLSILVEQAYQESERRGVFLSPNDQEARMILVRRMIGAIEAGETDPHILQDMALREEKLPDWNANADLFWMHFH
jgi:hypothetical protein